MVLDLLIKRVFKAGCRLNVIEGIRRATAFRFFAFFLRS